MGTRAIQPCKRGASLKKLTAAQRVFVEEMAADPQMNPTNAAKAAGYSHPTQAGARLVGLREIQAALGKVLHERIERCRLTADDVLEQLRAVLFLDPMDLFEKNIEGNFVLRDLDKVPVMVRRCITKVKQRSRERLDGSLETNVEVELMSKDQAMTAALKHLGLLAPDGTTINVNNPSMDWDRLCSPPNGKDVVEGKIKGK